MDQRALTTGATLANVARSLASSAVIVKNHVVNRVDRSLVSESHQELEILAADHERIEASYRQRRLTSHQNPAGRWRYQAREERLFAESIGTSDVSTVSSHDRTQLLRRPGADVDGCTRVIDRRKSTKRSDRV
jgi:hypothetical protein